MKFKQGDVVRSKATGNEYELCCSTNNTMHSAMIDVLEYNCELVTKFEHKQSWHVHDLKQYIGITHTYQYCECGYKE